MTALVLQADARCLPLPDASVDLVVTSPPYFGLRSYTDGGEHYAGQIGSEATPAAYVAALLDCTREWVRVLKPSGSLWVNLGDKYAGSRMDGSSGWDTAPLDHDPNHRKLTSLAKSQGVLRTRTDIPTKSLMGLPWRYALACIDELGLILRAEVIWSKPNGLPESVTDRVRRSHEQLFHFTKLPRYYSAVDEIRETYAPGTAERYRSGYGPNQRAVNGAMRGSAGTIFNGDTFGTNPLGKLPGSVWDIPSQPLTVPPHLGVDHFAAFPMELPRRIIAGWSPTGICAECGEGRRPVTIADPAQIKPWTMAQRHGRSWHGDGPDPKRTLGGTAAEPNRMISGYVCACPKPDAPTRPAVVLDPFGGTGTTALIASVLGRTGISIDRSADYCRLAAWRTTDPSQRATAMQVPKPPAQIDGQGQFDLAVPASP